MTCPLDLLAKRRFQYLGFTVAENAGRAFEFGQKGPNWLRAQGNRQVPRFDAVTGIEKQIRLGSKSPKCGELLAGEFPVEVVGVEDTKDGSDAIVYPS